MCCQIALRVREVRRRAAVHSDTYRGDPHRNCLGRLHSVQRARRWSVPRRDKVFANVAFFDVVCVRRAAELGSRMAAHAPCGVPCEPCTFPTGLAAAMAVASLRHLHVKVEPLANLAPCRYELLRSHIHTAMPLHVLLYCSYWLLLALPVSLLFLSHVPAESTGAERSSPPNPSRRTKVFHHGQMRQ